MTNAGQHLSPMIVSVGKSQLLVFTRHRVTET